MLKGIISEFKLLFIPCQGNNHRPEFFESRILFYLVIGLLLLKITVIPIFIYLPKNVFFADITETTLIKLLNQDRELLGIESLSENAKLNRAAFLKAKDMMEKDYFSHQSIDGFSPWYWFKKVGYNYKFAGENLAIGFLDSEEVHQAWLDSYAHKKNLLNPNYKEVGIAVVKGDFLGSETTIVVQLLGSSQTVIPMPKEESGIKTETQKEEEEEKEGEEQEEKEEEGEKKISPKLINGIFREIPKDNFRFTFFKFLSSNYNRLIQYLIYALLILIFISLLLNIFIKPEIQHRDLVLRSLVFIVLLSITFFLDKEIMIQMIPHNFYIQ